MNGINKINEKISSMLHVINKLKIRMSNLDVGTLTQFKGQHRNIYFHIFDVIKYLEENMKIIPLKLTE